MEDRLKLRYYEVDSISIIDHRVRFIKSKMAVAMNSEMAARMVSGCVASSLRPTVNRRPGRTPVLMSSPKAQNPSKTCCLSLLACWQ